MAATLTDLQEQDCDQMNDESFLRRFVRGNARADERVAIIRVLLTLCEQMAPPAGKRFFGVQKLGHLVHIYT